MLATACTAERLEGRVLLSTVTVTTPQDVVDVNLSTITMSRLANPAFNPDGQISLREAVRAARNTAGADTVNLPANTYVLGGTQLLYDATTAANSLTIQATGAANSTVIDANAASRILEVSGPGSVTLIGLKVQNGAGVDRGGAILNGGTLTLSNCTVAGNRAVGADGADSTEQQLGGGAGGDAFGGGIYSTGSLSLNGCTLSDNDVSGGFGGDGGPAAGDSGGRGGDAFGGAIYSTGKLNATNSLFTGSAVTGGHGGSGSHSGNEDAAGGDAMGGGVFNAAPSPAVFTDCTFSWNYVIVGGGGRGFVTNSRPGNPAGGGLYNADNATATLTRCTVADNGAGGGFAEIDTDGDGDDGPYFFYPAADARGGGIFNAGTLTATDLDVTSNASGGGRGAASDAEGPRGGGGYGGGIYNHQAASLSLTRATISGNSAMGGLGGSGLFAHSQGLPGPGVGGGIDNNGTLSLNAVTLADNLAAERGGAIANAGTLSARTVAISTNRVEGMSIGSATINAPTTTRGGGIDNTGTLTLVAATLSDNVVIGTDGEAGEVPVVDGWGGGDALGGALHNSSAATLVNVTLASNSVIGGKGGNAADGVQGAVPGVGGDGIGGAIANVGGVLKLVHGTLAGNTATGGAGGAGADPGSGLGGGIHTSGGGASVRIDNTIVAGNSANSTGPDVHGAFVSGPSGAGGTNLVGNVGNATGFVNGIDLVGGNGQPVINAKLAALADNGGPTRTMALLDDSPALGAGTKSLSLDAAGVALTTDQRGSGFARVVGVAVDIGAFEDQRTTASIAGTFFYDRDRSGVRDAGDPGLAGWTAYVDVNDNGTLDAGEPSDITDTDGAYAITGLAAGRYSRVREVRQDGWTRTLPAGAFPQGYYDLTLAPGEAETGRHFGNFKTQPAAPSAGDDAFTTAHETAVVLNVLANDAADIGLDSATVTIATPPAHGSATVDPVTGRITYTPAAGFAGDDSFTYTVQNIEGTETSPATVSLTVDPPVTLGIAIAGELPAEVVGGVKTKLKQAITITNLTDQKIAGPLTLTVYRSDDRTHFHPEDSAAVIKLKRLRLAPQASRTFTVKIDTADLASGVSHWLIAQARGDAGYSAAAWTDQSIPVAVPFVDLTGAFVAPLPEAMKPGKNATVRLTLENLGNVQIRERVSVALTTNLEGAEVPLTSPTLNVRLNPGASRQYKVRFAVPADLPTGPALIAAAVDPANLIVEGNEANNAFSGSAGVA